MRKIATTIFIGVIVSEGYVRAADEAASAPTSPTGTCTVKTAQAAKSVLMFGGMSMQPFGGEVQEQVGMATAKTGNTFIVVSWSVPGKFRPKDDSLQLKLPNGDKVKAAYSCKWQTSKGSAWAGCEPNFREGLTEDGSIGSIGEWLYHIPTSAAKSTQLICPNGQSISIKISEN